jgi:hypothetical protein
MGYKNLIINQQLELTKPIDYYGNVLVVPYWVHYICLCRDKKVVGFQDEPDLDRRGWSVDGGFVTEIGVAEDITEDWQDTMTYYD